MIGKPQIHKLLWLYPLVLFLVNALTKFLNLTNQDIGLDEPFSIYHAQFNAGTIISQLKNYNNPPLFELLLHFWIKLFGISPVSVRVFPLLFAALAPVALFYFGKRFFSLSTGIAASLLLSASSLLIYYAHDCRVYTLFLLLSILSMHFFLALLQENRSSIKTAGLFILFSSLLVYAHYFGVFILIFQCIYLCLFYRDRLKKFFAYYFLILLLYAPHLYVMLVRMSDSVSHGTWLKAPTGIESLYNMLWAFSNAPVVTVVCAIVLIVALIKAILTKDLPGNKTIVLIVIWFFLAYVGMFLVSYRAPMYISRYLIFVLPAYYILLVLCINYIFKNALLKIIFLTVFVMSFVVTADWRPDKKQHIREGVTVIKQFKDAATLVLVSPYDFLPAFAYHYNQAYFSAVASQVEYRLTDSLLKADNVYVVNDDFKCTYINTGAFKKIIYFGNGEEAAGAENPVVKALAHDYTVCYYKKFSSMYGISVLIRKAR